VALNIAVYFLFIASSRPDQGNASSPDEEDIVKLGRVYSDYLREEEPEKWHQVVPRGPLSIA
jgi:hypothetical protein